VAENPPRTPAEVRNAARLAREERSPIDRLDETRAEDYAQDVRLKGRYAMWLLGAMMVQLGIADAGFLLYAWLGVAWNVTPRLIEFWLSATVVEIVGIVLVVTRYLFPRRGRW
jgi:hypothetical protein